MNVNRLARLLIFAALVALHALIWTIPASAQNCRNGQCQRVVYYQAHAPRPVYYGTYTYTASVATNNPGGFLSWLNGVRAQHGLRPVVWDGNLAADAATNSAIQARRGLGHFYFGRARRQNSAMGGYSALPSLWWSSPAHRAALLDPTITRAAVAGYGAYWTFNAS